MRLCPMTHQGALAATAGTVRGRGLGCPGVLHVAHAHPHAPRAVRSSLSLLCAELRGSDEPGRKHRRLEKGIYAGLRPASTSASASASVVSPRPPHPLSPGAGCRL